MSEAVCSNGSALRSPRVGVIIVGTAIAIGQVGLIRAGLGLREHAVVTAAATVLGMLLVSLMWISREMHQRRLQKIKKECLAHWSYPKAAPGTGSHCTHIEGITGKSAALPPFEDVFFSKMGILIGDRLIDVGSGNVHLDEIMLEQNNQLLRIRVTFARTGMPILFGEEFKIRVFPQHLVTLARIAALKG